MKHLFLLLALSLSVLTASAADTPEDVFWQSVSKTDLAEEYRLYLEQFPKGKYVAEAWRRIGRLEVTPPKPIALIAERYRDNGDGTVTDVTTKLQWMRCAMGQTWTGAMCSGEPSKHNWEQARGLRNNFASHADWRLPTIDELKTLVYCSSGKPATWSKEGKGCDGDYRRPTLVDEAFPNTPNSFFWSGSPLAYDSNDAWGVYFGNGGANGYYLRSSLNSVRLVRGGQ
jgi:hypothetical protein